MERLTIEDAINRSRKLAERHRWNSGNTKLETLDENANEVYKNTCILYANQEEQYAEWLEELKSYKDIGTPKELKELKENGAFTGLELAKLAIMQKELKSYKDLEEQGLLLRMPCKVGDTVYVPTRNFISELRITLVSVNTNEMAMYFSWLLNSGIYPNLDGFHGYDLGKTVFLTREEAEKKLEEMKAND